MTTEKAGLPDTKISRYGIGSAKILGLLIGLYPLYVLITMLDLSIY